MTMDTLRTAHDLAQAGLIRSEDTGSAARVAARYAVAISPALARSIDSNAAADPIALQFVPDRRELEGAAGELTDPIGDHTHSPVEGIVHRYPDRVLLKLVNVCEVYCRFCFRREMVGPGRPAMLSKSDLDAAFEYIRADRGIWEVILTGGDPLVLSPRRLRAAMKAIADIEHVKVLRIHTRLPVAAPDKITPELVRAMRIEGKAVYVGLHVNHARELTAAARAACARMIDAGIPMVSQTVLLAGVNDSERAMEQLMRALVECRIKPYYLHHADMASGTSHFRTSIEAGQNLMRAIHGRLSGLCQPTYVLDIPGGHGKSPIGPVYAVRRTSEPQLDVVDFRGRHHRYPPDSAGAATISVSAGSTPDRAVPQPVPS